MLEHALKYAEKGFHIHPLRPFQKKPATKNGCNDATTDQEQIKKWWTQNPNYNIGIATGDKSGFFSLDIDDKKIPNTDKAYQGRQTLRSLEEVNGELPSTAQFLTPSTSSQMLYKMPPGVDIRSSKIGKAEDGLEIKATGGYIVAPPSYVKPYDAYIYEGPYEWFTDQSIDEIGFTDAPQWLIDRIKAKTNIVPKANYDYSKVADGLTIQMVKDYYKINLPSKGPGAFQGSHPIHGSSTGQNFKIDTTTNQWSCYNHKGPNGICTGGGPVSLVAMMEGIVSCEDSVRESLRGDDFTKTIDIIVKNFKIDRDKITTSPGKKPKTNELEKAMQIKNKYNIIFSEDENYRIYKDGYYQILTEPSMDNLMVGEFGCLRNNTLNLVLRLLRARSEKNMRKCQDKAILNLQNGLFNINTQEVKEHTPEVICMNQFSFDYDKDAKCDEWLKALGEILETDDKIDIFQEMFGLCFTQEIYGKAIVFLGEVGDNGKSTLLKVLKTMLGDDNICAIEPQSMDKAHNVARLNHKLANICSEISVSGVVADGPLKQIITGDPIEACIKYKSPFTFDPYCKVLFATNKLPYVEDKTEAFYQRLIIFNFTKIFRGKKAKYKYHKMLLKEQSGIFNWAMEGFKRLKARGRFNPSEAMQTHVDSYKKDNNPLMLYTDENCIIADNATAHCKQIYLDYQNYCIENGYRPLSKNKFNKGLELTYRGKVSRNEKTRPIQWEGISLLSVRERENRISAENTAVLLREKDKTLRLFKEKGYSAYGEE